MTAANFYSEKIRSYPLNEKGKDYVIGDIHGRYDLVVEALKRVNFDVNCDRLFCVGDLIDRGKNSAEVVYFLQLPYVHAIRGNHEDFLLMLYDNGVPTSALLEYYVPNMGLEWWLDVDEVTREKIIDLIRELPLVMEAQTKRGLVGFAHAEVELGYSWSEFKTAVNYEDESVVHNALWGRKRLQYHVTEPVPEIGRIYVGHTVQDKILKLGNVVAIDTGAVFDRHLTIATLGVGSDVIRQSSVPFDHIQVVDSVPEILIPFKENKREFGH